jgi:hypothetical protein
MMCLNLEEKKTYREDIAVIKKSMLELSEFGHNYHPSGGIFSASL